MSNQLRIPADIQQAAEKQAEDELAGENWPPNMKRKIIRLKRNAIIFGVLREFFGLEKGV